MKIAVLGAGGTGLAYAALLSDAGHQPVLWSPSGRGLAAIAAQGLIARGALTGRFHPGTAQTLAAAVDGAAVIVVALPGPARRPVFDALAPLLAPGQTVIVSADLSLGAQWLLARLPDPSGVDVLAWSTTVAMGRRPDFGMVEIGGIRSRVETAVLPQSSTQAALARCDTLFGPRFAPAAGGMAAILLGNLNPPVHMANALCNLTRIEKAEPWANYDGITPAVARLIEGLDAERLALAASFGVRVRSVCEHFQMSFGLPAGMSLAQMAAEIHRRRNGPAGPRDLETRFLVEDLPYGIAPLIDLGARQGVLMRLHLAGLDLLSAACGRDFRAMNTFWDFGESFPQA